MISPTLTFLQLLSSLTTFIIFHPVLWLTHRRVSSLRVCILSVHLCMPPTSSTAYDTRRWTTQDAFIANDRNLANRHVQENVLDKQTQQVTQQWEAQGNSWAWGQLEPGTRIQQDTGSMSLPLPTCWIHSPAAIKIPPRGTDSHQDSHTRLPPPKRAGF